MATSIYFTGAGRDDKPLMLHLKDVTADEVFEAFRASSGEPFRVNTEGSTTFVNPGNIAYWQEREPSNRPQVAAF